jgi:subtilase family serine protease
MRLGSLRWVPVLVLVAAAAGPVAGARSTGDTGAPRLPVPRLMLSDYEQVSTSETPPSPGDCATKASIPRRCFSPQALRAAYNLLPLYAAGQDGRGRTIAIVDSYGSDTITHDLHVFNTAFNIPPMCGEESVTCAPGMPTFSQLALQGSPATKAPPPTSNGPGQEDKSAWALEVSLDVEVAHAIAPGANILLVHTPTAETLGVQGFPQMMAAIKYVVDHRLADVVSMSLASAEDAFSSQQSLENLRYAFKAAAANGVTVLGASGDTGTANDRKSPVGQGGSTIPGPTVEWPASDPLVTGVGGTALCTSATETATRVVDNANPPAACQDPAASGQAEIVWDEFSRGIATGGGFSHVFARPGYQSALPAGSTQIPPGARGVPDIAMQASPRTGALVFISLPPDGQGGMACGAAPCSTGWYDIGGTSLATPEWAGLIAIAAQIKGHGLGPVNQALYTLASSGATYAADFHDVTVGNNQVTADIPGYDATAGWDPATGLGTPNAANLLPDLAAATP